MYKLSMFQVFSILSTSYLPLLFWIYPRYAAYYAGVDGQWALLGTSLIALYAAVLHGLLNQRFHQWSGAEMPALVYGKLLGRTVSVLFVPGYLLFVAVSIYSFSISSQALLPNTPRLAIVIAMALVAVLAAGYGLETLARLASLIFPVTFLILGLSFIFVFFRGDWLGVFFHPVSLTTSALVAGRLLPIFFGMNFFLMLSPHYDHRGKNSVWLPLLAVGLSSAMLLGMYVLTIRVVGYEGIRVLSHPIDFVLQLVQVHGLIVQRFGLVLVFISTMFEVVFFANHLWAISQLTVRTLPATRRHEGWLIVGYAVVILAIFQAIPNQQVGDWIVVHLLVPLSWAYLIVEPTLKYVLSYRIRKRLPRMAPPVGQGG